MIPKTIHYCWFGRKPLPDLAIKCINSWKKYLPEYEIKEWNEDNFDVNIIPYTKEAYESKKYAFVSDYARYWIIYNYGGIYFDTDVEIIKTIDDIIEKGAFLGCEIDINTNPNKSVGCNPGLGFGGISGHSFYFEILKQYENLHFINNDGTYNLKTIVEYTTELLMVYGLQNISSIQYISNIWIYPKEYFCPIDYETQTYNATINTRTIHHFVGSWVPKEATLPRLIRGYFGEKVLYFLVKIKQQLKYYVS